MIDVFKGVFDLAFSGISNKWNMTCFGFHCFAISKILLEIKYSDLGPGFRCTCMQRLNGPKITVEEVCNKTFEYLLISEYNQSNAPLATKSRSLNKQR